jgi:hypothetical protein
LSTKTKRNSVVAKKRICPLSRLCLVSDQNPECNGSNYMATVYIKAAKIEGGVLKVRDTFFIDMS